MKSIKFGLRSSAQKNVDTPIIAEAKKAGIIVQFVDKRKLDQMVEGVQHQGVVAQAAAYRYFEIDEILERARESGEMPFLLLLDEIEDPHNLGFDSADCGMHRCSWCYYSEAPLCFADSNCIQNFRRGSRNMCRLPALRIMAQTIDKLKEAGIWIAGADVGAKQDVFASRRSSICRWPL